MSAKIKFLLLVQEASELSENSEQEIQRKMQYIEESNVSYAILWTLFWVIIFLPAIFIWIFAIIINQMNYSRRRAWRKSEYERLWYKLNTMQMNAAKTKNENSNPKKKEISTDGLSGIEKQIVENYKKQAEKEKKQSK